MASQFWVCGVTSNGSYVRHGPYASYSAAADQRAKSAESADPLGLDAVYEQPYGASPPSRSRDSYEPLPLTPVASHVGSATVEIKGDTRHLDAALDRATDRVRRHVAAMQRLLDELVDAG